MMQSPYRATLLRIFSIVMSAHSAAGLNLATCMPTKQALSKRQSPLMQKDVLSTNFSVLDMEALHIPERNIMMQKSTILILGKRNTTSRVPRATKANTLTVKQLIQKMVVAMMPSMVRKVLAWPPISTTNSSYGVRAIRAVVSLSSLPLSL